MNETGEREQRDDERLGLVPVTRGVSLGISERKTNLNPAQVDYALRIRSVEKSTTSYTVNN